MRAQLLPGCWVWRWGAFGFTLSLSDEPDEALGLGDQSSGIMQGFGCRDSSLKSLGFEFQSHCNDFQTVGSTIIRNDPQHVVATASLTAKEPNDGTNIAPNIASTSTATPTNTPTGLPTPRP